MNGKNSRPKDWKEARRKRAFELKELGWRSCEIAEALGVSRAAISQWFAEPEEKGDEAWRSTVRPRRHFKLSREQFNSIPELLSHGAEAYGFLGEVWTCSRVATVIWREFGVSYHKAHVSRLLKQLGWTPQTPIQQAAQRDELQIEEWRKEVWPELKKRL